MSQQKLRADLEELYAELKQTGSVGSEQRQLLETLSREIQRLLSRSEEHEEQYSGLSAQLKEAVAALEASHPRVTLLMRQVIDSLAYLGI